MTRRKNRDFEMEEPVDRGKLLRVHDEVYSLVEKLGGESVIVPKPLTALERTTAPINKIYDRTKDAAGYFRIAVQCILHDRESYRRENEYLRKLLDKDK